MTDAKALAPQQRAYAVLRDLLEKKKGELQQVATRHLTAERLCRIALSVTGRDDRLLQSTPESLLRAVMDCAKLGLEPTGRVGGAYLVAYRNNKKGVYEAQVLTDYRGEITLALRSGAVLTVKPYIVGEHEEFWERGGSAPELHHNIIHGAEKRGPMIAAYAIAKLPDGQGYDYHVLSIDQVERRRKMSKQPDSGPWRDHYEAMAMKTAIRALCNRLPKSAEVAEFMAREDAADTGNEDSIITIDTEAEPSPPTSKTERLTESLKREREVDDAVERFEQQNQREREPGSDG